MRYARRVVRMPYGVTTMMLRFLEFIIFRLKI